MLSVRLERRYLTKLRCVYTTRGDSVPYSPCGSPWEAVDGSDLHDLQIAQWNRDVPNVYFPVIQIGARVAPWKCWKPLMDIGYIIAGFVVGWLVGLTGVGGGSLMTPVLLLVFNVKAAVAVGTDLLYAAITKSAGILAHGRLGNIDWRLVGLLAAGSVPAAVLTTVVLGQAAMDSTALVNQIRFWLGIALLLTSLSVLYRQELLRSLNQEDIIRPDLAPMVTVLLGLLLGVLVTLTSVGAGALGVTALLLLYPHTPINRIVGSDVAHAVPITLVAGLGHAVLGTVDYGLLGTLLIGSIPGIWIGSHMTTVINENWVRVVLAAILVYVGQKLAFPGLNQLLGVGLVAGLVALRLLLGRRAKPGRVEGSRD